ncbi:DUF4215 domain-containing protein [Acidobacteria bacterium AH-259-G07]|nr:DUF4215 domain-containing protein [Acidobacteria bacterium AH-259-G07]
MGSCELVGGAVCGSGVPETAEACEDGNTNPGDGCSATCVEEFCGNGILDPGEECDDGNFLNSDSCSVIHCTIN